MNNLYNKMTSSDNLFDGHFIDSKALYLYYFNVLPNVTYINRINGEKAFKAFSLKYADQILHVHAYRWYKHQSKSMQFSRTLVVMQNECIIEFESDFFQVLHKAGENVFADEATAFVKRFKQRERKQPLEINIIVQNRNGMHLQQMEIKPTKLDVDLYYEDDFKVVDSIITARLHQKKDKGIVLLHGLPGTGKTTYLRYLIGKIKKRVLFVSPGVAGHLMNPDFIDLLINNPNSVVIIEDAENIIMDRRATNDASVSNLLNISDGLLADFLNVQLICTFNSSLTLVDSALMRKGRLIAKYEFQKLSVAKAQKLSDHFGFDNTITKPMTIAEIATQNEQTFGTKQVQVLGFRGEEVLN